TRSRVLLRRHGAPRTARGAARNRQARRARRTDDRCRIRTRRRSADSYGRSRARCRDRDNTSDRTRAAFGPTWESFRRATAATDDARQRSPIPRAMDASVLPRRAMTSWRGNMRASQPFDYRMDVERCRIERRNTGNALGSQQQRQLRAAEDDAVDLFGVAQPFDERLEAAACLVAKVAAQELADVPLVHPRALDFIRYYHGNTAV